MLKLFPIFTAQIVSTSAGTPRGKRKIKHNMAYNPHNSDLAGDELITANFDFFTTDRKAAIWSAVIATSSKLDLLLIAVPT